MDSADTRRQFIAGARCPDCGALDRIQRCQNGADVWMACVACGMRRDLDAAPAGDRDDTGGRLGKPVSWKE